MNDTGTATIDELLDEIRCYLDALELFRAEGCEPRWCDASLPEEVLR
jgi:hypothetical protein